MLPAAYLHAVRLASAENHALDVRQREALFVGYLMRSGAPPITAAATSRRAADTLGILAFAATLFLSAALLFAIQPVVGKMVLPLLGGTPQVWNTCMVFFQAMLFAGYLHAHYSGLALGRRRQALLHLLLASSACFALPIGLAADIHLVDPDHPIAGLLKMLMVSVGLPVFVISSTAPLVQRWFAETQHPGARDPYFLYAASNLGSLTALLGYPLIMEPAIVLSQQARLLSAGYLSLTVALGVCAWQSFRQAGAVVSDRPATDAGTSSVSWRERAHWLVLSMVPSSLLLGVTTHITTDIAAVPLFWVLPLALYLLSFVIVFARRPLISRETALRWQALLISMLVALMFLPGVSRIWPMLIVHLLAFFSTALVCHGELVRTRPAAAHLTEFYLWMSAGGLLGGMFNSLLAPAIFTLPIEYPLMLALACLLRPNLAVNKPSQRSDALLPLALAVVLLATSQLAVGLDGPASRFVMQVAIVILTACALLAFSARPVRYALGVGVALFSVGVWSHSDRSEAGDRLGAVSRSFFGVYQVQYRARTDMNVLVHGTTVHGAQLRAPTAMREPVLYYARGGAFGGLFQSQAKRLQHGRVAIVGLGVGGLSCYGHPGSEWTYYEIDPLVERIARDPRHFSFLQDCPPTVRVVIGDARLSMQRAPSGHYAMIIIDAFSSDAIPTHLLTREALASYLDKLAPHGILAIHISNRFLDLEPVVGALAREARLIGRSSPDTEIAAAGKADVPTTHAHVVVLARQADDLGTMATSPQWRTLAVRPGERVWTDDYVNVLAALRWGRPAPRDERPPPPAGGGD